MLKSASLLLLVFALVACGPPPVKRSQQQLSGLWQRHQEANGAVTQWHLDGRIGMENGHEAWHASLIWRRSPDKYDLRLVGPLGAGSVVIKGNAEGVSLRTDKGKVIRETDPDRLIYRAMGWQLPVRSLEYWVRGLPQPGDVVMEWDNDGRLSSLLQHGWQVRFDDYRDASPALPESIELTRDDLRIRLHISRWRV